MGDIKVALITGTSSGFGMLTAIELAKDNYFVVATMRNVDKKERLIERCKENGILHLIEILQLDVTDELQVKRVVKQIIESYGRIDVLVNNAGVSVGGFTEETTLADWEYIMETNFFGSVSVTRAILPFMREQKSGKIINVSSVSGRIGFPGYGPYAASKFALEGFSESLRLEMLPYGVEVILVEPGVYETDIWSKGFNYIELRKKENSPYETPFSAVLSYSKNLTKNASQPQEVAKKIAKIVRVRHPNFRYVLGKGSMLAICAKALLPWKWFERIILRQLNK